MEAKCHKLDETIQSSTSQDGDGPTTSTDGQVDNQQQSSGQDTKCKYTKKANISQVGLEQNQVSIYIVLLT